ncbi:hypothetical protein ORF_00005 [Halorubrum tailed virus]|nr:hypothetical protein ORF_00005 [Halorubrum tailed virus]
MGLGLSLRGKILEEVPQFVLVPVDRLPHAGVLQVLVDGVRCEDLGHEFDAAHRLVDEVGQRHLVGLRCAYELALAGFELVKECRAVFDPLASFFVDISQFDVPGRHGPVELDVVAVDLDLERVLVAGDEQVAGHGYVQKRNGQTRYFAEAGDRQNTDLNDNPDPRYVDRETGEVYNDIETMRNEGAKPANELLFIPNPHPNTLYYGLPTWISEIQTMVADQEARRFNRERLENNLVMDYLIIVEGGELSEESRKEVREHIEGLRDGDGPGALILEADDLVDKGIGVEDQNVKIRVEPAAHYGDEDMSFANYREMNEKDIAKVHHVPLQILGNHDATNANTEEAIREFTEETIAPEQERYAERLYRVIHQQILDVHDWTVDFVTKGARNERERAEIGKMTADSVKEVLTVNQALELFGLEPRDDEIGERLVSEVSTQQTPGAALDEAVTQVEQSAREEKADERIKRGASGD